MAKSSSIEEECKLIKNVPDSDQLKTSLDTIVNELNKTKSSPNAKTFEQIVSTISFRFNHDRIFSTAHLLPHPLFIQIRNYYLHLMIQWRAGQSPGEVFTQIGILFFDFCQNAPDTDTDALKILLLDESLIKELCKCLKEIGIDGKHANDDDTKAIDYYLRAISSFEKGRTEIQSLQLVSDLLDQLLNCVCSKYFLQLFNKLGELKTLNCSETLLLDSCTDFISWHDAGRYNDTHIAVRTALLHPFISFLGKNLLSLTKFSKISIKVLGQLSITLIGGNGKDEDIFPSPIREDYCQMIDQITSILNSIIESKNLDELKMNLIQVLTQCLYSLTMTNDLRMYIKTKHIVSLLLNLTNLEDETIQFHVYRILASILTEEDIKTLTNTTKIANVFIKFLTNLIDDTSRAPRFYNLLRSLKILVQHDQIKEELTKQEILPLLIRCATETKFDSIKVRLPALEILLALTFNNHAANQLKQNSAFLSHLKSLSNQSIEQRLQRVAEGILWKLEKEQKDISANRTNPTKKEYHVMLSYSHSDKDLCYQIHDRLVKDHFKVWIDRDQMHGQTMVAMANAIENSEFVFICMSEAYKRSAYCQSEAHYAFERHCLLIPLIMKANYRPDGWLGILISGKIYVDFTKVDFDTAYQRLINEVNRHRTDQGQMNNIQKRIEHHLPMANPVVKIDSHSHQQQHFTDYPSNINDWTNDHVKSFLINEKFEILLPVLSNMNGRLILETYQRCKEHWEFMFQTFKTEVAADGHHKTLTIFTYIRFLDQIEKYIPQNSRHRSQKSSSICTLL